MLLKDFISESARSLCSVYPAEEARRIVVMLCEELLSLPRYFYLVEPGYCVPREKESHLSEALKRLQDAEPLQYVLGHTEFCSFDFKLTHDVLIPRPETECLVDHACAWISERTWLSGHRPRIIDLCTGSGCIAWTMALRNPGSSVMGVDISPAALAVAEGQNFSSEMESTGAVAPEFVRKDVLEDPSVFCADFQEGVFDLILSNPPYVLDSQKAEMRRNVLEHEPSLALFVPDSDPLVFYRAIASLSSRLMAPGAAAFVEINDALGPRTLDLFLSSGFKASLLKDCFDKDRFIVFERT